MSPGRGSIQVGSRGRKATPCHSDFRETSKAPFQSPAGKSFKVNSCFVLVQGSPFAQLLIVWFDGQSQDS